MTEKIRLVCCAYYRLSKDDLKNKESESIENQRNLIRKYCKDYGYSLVKEFVDDGFSGGNFNRPAFKQMLEFLESNKIDIVITKDSSRLGRDLGEASYYVDNYFPEHGIRYLALTDNIDSDRPDAFNPMRFAFNEVYIRDTSIKITEVLKSKRELGQYCACPPYGYKKDERQKKLIINPDTAPIVQKIFSLALSGNSTRDISNILNTENIVPPLKYRALNSLNFSENGTMKASDYWNYTTVKRILRNEAYLGNTLLGKTRKVSVKSKKKIPIDKSKWIIHKNTHEPLVTQENFDKVQLLLLSNTKKFSGKEEKRNSIFSKIVYCKICGRPMMSGGSVYNGERMKYWYLCCDNNRTQNSTYDCKTRVNYRELLDFVKMRLNYFISLNDKQISSIIEKAVEKQNSQRNLKELTKEILIAKKRLTDIDSVIEKLYLDNAEGKIDDDRLNRMVLKLQTDSKSLENKLKELNQQVDNINETQSIKEKYEHFFIRTRNMQIIENLDREKLLQLIERIEISPKVYKSDHKHGQNKSDYKQEVIIYFKFIGVV